MNDLQFDDFVKKQMSDHTTDVPGHVLENVIAARKRSDPKGFWMFFNRKFLLLASLILMLTTGGYFLVSQKDSLRNRSLPNKNTGTTPAAELIDDKNISEFKTGDIKEDKKDIRESETKPAANNTRNDQQISSKANDQNTTVSKKHVVPGSRYVHNAKAKSNLRSRVYGAGNSDDILNQTSDQNVLLNKEPNFNETRYFNQVLVPFTFADTKEFINSKKLSPKLIFPKCPTIEDNAAGNKKYWEVYAGPDLPIGDYKTAVNDSSTSIYLQKRKEASKISYAYSAGIRYTKVFNNGMSVRSGLNYSQINEKFRYINQNELKLVTVITTRIIVRSPGDTLFIKDTLQYQQSGTRIKTTLNHYRSIDIPLVLGYELGNGRLHANINAGIIINVYSWYKGDVLDTSYQPVSITTGKNSPYQFKNNIGVGFLGGVSVYYKLTDDLHLLIEPYFRYNLSPMSKENLNLQQKYHTTGIRAGLRFDLK